MALTLVFLSFKSTGAFLIILVSRVLKKLKKGKINLKDGKFLSMLLGDIIYLLFVKLLISSIPSFVYVLILFKTLYFI